MTHFEIFRRIFSPEQSVRDEALPIIFDAMNKPEFLDFLISSLLTFHDENTINENILIVQSILIVFHEYMKKINIDQPFFQDNQIEISFSTLFTMLFSFPLEIRHLINNVLARFLYIYKYKNFDDFVNRCCMTIQENNSVIDSAFALRFVFDWCNVQSRVGESKTKFEAFSQTFVTIFDPSIQSFLSVFSSLPSDFIQYLQMPNDTNKLQIAQQFKDVQRSTELTLQCMFYAIKIIREIRVINLIEFPECMSILSCLTNFLSFNMELGNFVLNVKKEIIGLLADSLVLFRNVENYRPAKRPFLQSFQTHFGPLMVTSVLSCFSTNGISLELTHLVFRFLKEKLYLDSILGPDFITKIIFPASCLTDEDLQNFVDLPEHYIEFCLIFEQNNQDTMDSVRQIIEQIIKILPIELIQMLMEFLATPSTTTIESEAKIFLTTLIYLHHKPPVDLFPQTIDVLSQHRTNLQLFEYSSLCTLLSVLVSISSELEESILKQCIDIALFSLLNCDSVVVRLCSIDLLYAILDQPFFFAVPARIEEILPLSTIIETILKLSIELKHEFIGRILEKLVYLFPEFFVPTNLEYIKYIFTLWASLQDDDDEGKTSSLLLSISKIISSIPNNSPLLEPIMVYITPAVLKALPNNYMCVPQLIDILGCLCDKIDNPPTAFFMLILTFLINFVFKQETYDDQLIHNYEEYTVVICSLICRHNFFSTENAPEGVLKIIEACYLSEEHELLTTAFIILTCFFQAASKASINTEHAFTLLSKAMEIVRTISKGTVNDYDDDYVDVDDTDNSIFLSSLLLISTGLIINTPLVIQMLDAQFLDNWIANYQIDYYVGEKVEFLQWTTTALLLLSSLDLGQREIQFFKIAVEQFLYLKNLEAGNISDKDSLLQYSISFFPFEDLKCEDHFKQIERTDPRLCVLDEKTIELFFGQIENAK